MDKLSVALAVYNEEENIARCLESVKDLASEIVIVDGTSQDKTVEIAKRYNAKILITKNHPIFHINKQIAIDMCTGDWVLQLDADEVVSKALADEIKNKISNPIKSESNIKNDDINGYWIPRKNWFLSRFLMKGGQYPDYTLRLYKKGKGRLPQVDVHEQAVVDGKVGYLRHSLLHYPYKNFSAYLTKWNRYTSLIALQTKEKLKNKSLLGKIFFAVLYLLIKPLYWFILTYIRHKGFLDLWPGFVFSFFSSLRYPIGYIKYLKMN